MKTTLVVNGTIGREDFALFSIVDRLEEIRFLINEHFRVFAELRPKKRAKKRSKSDARE
jgi:hypothetical protein